MSESSKTEAKENLDTPTPHYSHPESKLATHGPILEFAESASESIKEFREELHRALAENPSTPTPLVMLNELAPKPETKRVPETPKPREEVRESGGKEAKGEEARASEGECADESKHEGDGDARNEALDGDGGVDARAEAVEGDGESIPEEMRDVVEFAKDLAKEGKLACFKEVMSRIEIGRVESTGMRGAEQRVTKAEAKKTCANTDSVKQGPLHLSTLLPRVRVLPRASLNTRGSLLVPREVHMWAARPNCKRLSAACWRNKGKSPPG